MPQHALTPCLPTTTRRRTAAPIERNTYYRCLHAHTFSHAGSGNTHRKPSMRYLEKYNTLARSAHVGRNILPRIRIPGEHTCCHCVSVTGCVCVLVCMCEREERRRKWKEDKGEECGRATHLPPDHTTRSCKVCSTASPKAVTSSPDTSKPCSAGLDELYTRPFTV